MASITEVKVNGYASDGTLLPYVAGINPIITWEYVTDIISPVQSLYEIRIGTDSTNLGTDFFVSNIFVNTIESSNNTFEYTNNDLLRGISYYGQIQSTDTNGNKTDWAVFSFITNTLPFISNFRLQPSSPNASQDIELFYDYHDIDGQVENNTKIQWFRNNLQQNEYDSLCILPALATNPGDSWTAKITPCDGLEFGGTYETEAVSVADTDVDIEDVFILPFDANVDDVLKLDYSILENEYISLDSAIEIDWYVNEVLTSTQTNAFVRLNLEPNDVVYAIIKIVDNGAVLSQKKSREIIILDVPWRLYDIYVSGLKNPVGLTDLSPVIEYKVYKTTAAKNQNPSYMQVKITKTPSIDGAIYDSGVIGFKNSFIIPENQLDRGQKYYLHVAVDDAVEIPDSQFKSVLIETAGSSWSDNVSNTNGWTIEFKLSIGSTDNSNGGIYIHDGSYFCAINFFLRKIVLLSEQSVTFTYPETEPDLSNAKTFKVVGRNNDIFVYMNNKLVIDGTGLLESTSSLKQIEYGDIDGKNTNHVVFRFFRYSTEGAYGIDEDLSDKNTFYFNSLGEIENGSIEYVLDNTISWLPHDASESTKLFKFNENSKDITLSTVNKNYSPITSIYIDDRRNKFIGTSNGVTAIFGEKHDPDFIFIHGSEPNAFGFDRISNLDSSKFSLCEQNYKTNWLTLDTTYRAVGDVNTSSITSTGDPYDPYVYGIDSHAIHYFSQRTHGHAWYDNVNNAKGWQIKFSFDLDILEPDDIHGDSLNDKRGVGFYINDGTYQEILYFYEDKIRLFYANVYVALNTKVERDYVISVKEKNIKIFQKPTGSTTQYGLLLDGSGIFTMPSAKTGNSRKPKIIFDQFGVYHSVWHDDSNGRSQIFYSSFSGSAWSNPEIVTQTTQFSLKNPDLTVDESGRIWVTYEDTSWGPTEISVSVKDSVGWNPKTRITNSKSNKSRPAIKFDGEDTHLVWEDDRYGRWMIFWALWKNSKKAWQSSAQFGDDTIVMQMDKNDPYQNEQAIDFKNAKLALLNSQLWLVCEGILTETNISSIYRGFFDIETNAWNTSGTPTVNDDGEVTAYGYSIQVSEDGRDSRNPSISADSNKETLIIVWEDRSEPIRQIWGAAVDSSGSDVISATQLTDQLINCNTPSVGWISNYAIILFEQDNNIYLNYYDSIFTQFSGSNTGGEDRLISLTSKSASNPCMPPNTPSTTFRAVYDFVKIHDEYDVISEFPDFQMIGDVTINHSSVSMSESTETENMGDSFITNIDTTEFAFGDFSDGVGIRASFKDISFYFGYDAIPNNELILNSNTIPGWPDSRINDLFVDVFGNIVAATFGGLIYYNVSNGNLLTIQGKTTEYSSDDGCTADTCLLNNKIITSVKWGKNGIWYIGTTSGVFCSKNAGKTWFQLFADSIGNKIINDIDVDTHGRAIIAAYSNPAQVDDGIFIAHPDMAAPIQITTPDSRINTVKIDENSIIWAGSNSGLYRIENNSNIISFNRNNGMRSSQVNDIAIVNKYLRYIATPTGIERMHGTKFTNFNVRNTDLLNNNISSIEWNNKTNSLWVGALYELHEIIFRDPEHNVIQDEVVRYNTTEISTENAYEKSKYSVVDFNLITNDSNFDISNDSVKVYINKNQIDFGYSVINSGQIVSFDTDLLSDDDVEINVSNRFIKEYDFNQTSIEKEVLGFKRTNIIKMDRTSRNQLLLLSDSDNPAILMDAGISSLPFTTIVIDRDLPIGCLEQLETITQNIIRFRVFASDQISGIESMILSNYENFTSDGVTPLSYQPYQSVVDHDIGSNLTNVFDSYSFDTGTGSTIAAWFNESEKKEYLYACTNSPATVLRFDPAENEWSTLGTLDEIDTGREVHEIAMINGILWITTGTETVGGTGNIYRSTDGINFDLFTSVSGKHVRGIAEIVDGTVYFGSDEGKIYSYKNGSFSLEYENIGSSIYSLWAFENILYVGTGEKGRVYSIDLTTGNSLIIFDAPDSAVNNIFVKNSDNLSSDNNPDIFISGNQYSTIYRTKLDDIQFTKSYQTINKPINRIKEVSTKALLDPNESTNVVGTTVVAIIKNTLFKYNGTSWEFFYQHEEEINDFEEYTTSGINGIWVISDSKITKWSAVKETKNVFLKVRDKAGNESLQPKLDTSSLCPNDSTSVCCDTAYSLNIKDLQNFVNESKILNISEYGEIIYTYNSPSDRVLYSGDVIDQEIGIYVSEIFNGTNDLISWKSISWESTEPDGTSVKIQIRASSSETDIQSAEWSDYLDKDERGIVNIEYLTKQYIQFRIVLSSSSRDISPTLTSVTIRNLTAFASHFFTTNFILPSKPIKGLLTANTFLPISADVVFGINTNNSTTFSDYQIIEPNRLFTTNLSQIGSNLRIGAKLLTPNLPQLQATSNPGDPYDSSSFLCNIDFDYTNLDSTTHNYHFRASFYNDIYRTQLIHVFFTGNDQTGWTTNLGSVNEFPGTGISLSPSSSVSVTFSPATLVETDQKWYITIEAYNGTYYETIIDDQSYICSDCNISNESGLIAEYYLTGGLSELPDFNALTPTYSLTDTNINFPLTSSDWVTTGGQTLSGFTSGFAARWKGRIQAPTDGTYTFKLDSDDGAKLVIDNEVIIDNDGLHPMTSKSGTVDLDVGFHDFEVQFFQNSFDAGIILYWTLPGDTHESIVPSSRFYHAVASEYCDTSSVPLINNLIMVFELENGENIKLNLS